MMISSAPAQGLNQRRNRAMLYLHRRGWLNSNIDTLVVSIHPDIDLDVNRFALLAYIANSKLRD